MEVQNKNETLLASLAHFSILTVLIIGPLSLLIPLLIWLSERTKTEHSKFIEFQAKQAFFYQLGIYLIFLILGIITAILWIILIGMLLVPILVLLGCAAIAYGIYGGIQTWKGISFRYYFLADFIEL
jgi:uncharacterized Tic20 family protein